jgi:hypothetical protein
MCFWATRVTIYQGYPRLRREGFYLACVYWGCVKRFLPPTAAEYSSERHVILTISLREIVKMTCLSKHNSARSAVKNLFTQPRPRFERIIWREALKKRLFTKPRSKLYRLLRDLDLSGEFNPTPMLISCPPALNC